MTTVDNQIDAFLARIVRALPGPGYARTEIIDELRDGILAAVDFRERRGENPEGMVARALSEFGDPDKLARCFFPELAARRARFIARRLLVSAAMVVAVWIVAARTRELNASHGLFDGTATHAAALVLLGSLVCTGLLTLSATGRASCSLGRRPVIPLLSAAAMAIIAMLTDLAALLVLTAPLASYTGTIHRLALSGAVLASLGHLVLSGRAGTRIIRDTARVVLT